jgi:hypothetical protein
MIWMGKNQDPLTPLGATLPTAARRGDELPADTQGRTSGAMATLTTTDPLPPRRI